MPKLLEINRPHVGAQTEEGGILLVEPQGGSVSRHWDVCTGWEMGLLMEVDPSGHLDSQWALPQAQAYLYLISFDFTATHTGRAILSTPLTRLVPAIHTTGAVP